MKTGSEVGPASPSSRKVYPEEGSKRKLWIPFAPERDTVGGALSDLKEACESGISESTIIILHINGRSLVTQELPPGCSK